VKRIFIVKELFNSKFLNDCTRSYGSGRKFLFMGRRGGGRAGPINKSNQNTQLEMKMMYLKKNKTPDSHSQQWEKQDWVEVRP
jgi:hypothetical protein